MDINFDYHFDETLHNLIEEIQIEIQETSCYTECYSLSPPVIKALLSVPRHYFVPSNQQKLAYKNIPLPIGHQQTISQPYIVALMTELLNIDSSSIVLEIGTGSGYQAAILSRIAKHVYSVERIPELAYSAQEHLKNLGVENVTVSVDDGYNGLKEKSPFDGIIVTAASKTVPANLIEQLKNEKSMIIPLENSFYNQNLYLLKKMKDGTVKNRNILPVVFVPLVHDKV